MYCVVLYTRYRCIHCMLGIGACIAWLICHVCLYVCDAHYVYMHMVEEKALRVSQVWQIIQCVYKIRTKVEANE